MKVIINTKDGNTSKFNELSSIVIYSDEGNPLSAFVQPDPESESCIQITHGDKNFEKYIEVLIDGVSNGQGNNSRSDHV